MTDCMYMSKHDHESVLLHSSILKTNVFNINTNYNLEIM